ncbi:MAG: STT3 domain-containing protein [Desulfosoma sp.]|uniref:STT3 domain-containing protein n=1 Tax=Desulfosoma sp. TaxID=2603217 RepID=UPI00404AC874
MTLTNRLGLKRLAIVGGLTAVIALGFWVRFAPYGAWKQHPDRCFVHGDPLPTTFDAPYYMRLARDVVEGNYERRDLQRAVPDAVNRPRPAPLLSLLTAGIHQLSGISIPKIALVLPAVLGALSALCLYLPARLLMAPSGTVIACAALVFSPFLVHRTNLGRFDTDSLNVGLPLLVIGCLMAWTQARRRAGLWLAAATLFMVFHAWWWDQSPQTPFLLAVLPLCTALILRFRAGDRASLWIVFGLLAGAAGGVFLFKGAAPFLDAAQRAWGQLMYMMVKQAPTDFPNIGLSISEQVRPTLTEFGRSVAGHSAVLGIALVGLLWLFLSQPKTLGFLAPLMVLGFGGIFLAQRLTVYAAPLVGLGLGTLVDRGQRRLGASHLALVGPLVVGILALLPAFVKVSKTVRWPSENALVVQGMVEAARRTPENAVLWAWWDHGYHIQYWARRGTLADGEIHGGERVVPLAIPLASTDDHFAADFMIFFSTRGLSGMQAFFRANNLSAADGLAMLRAMLAAGPEHCEAKAQELGLQHIPSDTTWRAFFFPDPPRPVYLFLDQLLLNTAYWWYWFGTWNPATKNGIHPAYRPLYPVVVRNEASSTAPVGTATVHLQRGELHLSDRIIPLATLGLIGQDGTRTLFRYRRDNGPHLDVQHLAGLGVLMQGAPIGESLFHRLFFVQASPPSSRFRLIAHRPFVYQLWHVLPARGDGRNAF